MNFTIKVNETSPRKFRQDPSTRGVGGKWGPAGEDPLMVAQGNRKGSIDSWQKDAGIDDMFLSMLTSKLQTTMPAWEYDGEFGTKDTLSFNGNLLDIFGETLDIPVYNSDVVSSRSTNAAGIDRLLKKICDTVSDRDDCGGAGCWLEFYTQGSGIRRHYGFVKLYIFRPYFADDNDIPLPSRSEVVSDIVETIGNVTAYLKKMAPVIKRECSRDFQGAPLNVNTLVSLIERKCHEIATDCSDASFTVNIVPQIIDGDMCSIDSNGKLPNEWVHQLKSVISGSTSDPNGFFDCQLLIKNKDSLSDSRVQELEDYLSGWPCVTYDYDSRLTSRDIDFTKVTKNSFNADMDAFKKAILAAKEDIKRKFIHDGWSELIND